MGVASSRHKPKWDGASISRQLRQYDRVPFMDLLSVLIEMFPSEDALAEFAKKNPDRFIFGMVQLGRIAGFTDRQEVLVDLLKNVHSMSDSELADHLRRLAPGLSKLIEAAPLAEVGPNSDGAT